MIKKKLLKLCVLMKQIMKYEKQVVVLCINRIVEQFNKLKKYHAERIIQIYDFLKQNLKNLNLDSVNLVKLI